MNLHSAKYSAALRVYLKSYIVFTLLLINFETGLGKSFDLPTADLLAVSEIGLYVGAFWAARWSIPPWLLKGTALFFAMLFFGAVYNLALLGVEFELLNLLIGARFYLKFFALMVISYCVADPSIVNFLGKLFRIQITLFILVVLAQLVAGNAFVSQFSGTFARVSIVGMFAESVNYNIGGSDEYDRLPLVGLMGNYNTFGTICLWLSISLWLCRDRKLAVLFFIFSIFSLSRAVFVASTIILLGVYLLNGELLAYRRIFTRRLFGAFSYVIVLSVLYGIFGKVLDLGGDSNVEAGVTRLFSIFSSESFAIGQEEMAREWLLFTFAPQVLMDYSIIFGAGIAKFGNAMIYLTDPEVYLRYYADLSYRNDSTLAVQLIQTGVLGTGLMLALLWMRLRELFSIIFSSFVALALLVVSAAGVGYFDYKMLVVFFLFLPYSANIGSKVLQGKFQGLCAESITPVASGTRSAVWQINRTRSS